MSLNKFYSGNLHNPHSVESEHIFQPSSLGYIGVKLKEILYIKAETVYSQLYLSMQDKEIPILEEKRKELMNMLLVVKNK